MLTGSRIRATLRVRCHQDGSSSHKWRNGLIYKDFSVIQVSFSSPFTSELWVFILVVLSSGSARASIPSAAMLRSGLLDHAFIGWLCDLQSVIGCGKDPLQSWL